jgi:monoamine oxidase
MRLPKKYQTKLNTFLAQFSWPKDPKVLAYDEISLEDLFFQIFGWNSDSYEFEDLLESNEFAEDVKSVSAANYIMYKLQWGGSDGMDFKIAWWNEALTRALVLYLKNKWVTFFKDTRVVEVHKTKQHFAVITKKDTFYAQQVVCALPIKAMGQIIWKPTLPKEKMRYINTIPYGRVTKWWAMTKGALPEKMGLCDDTVLHTLYNAWRGQSCKKNEWLLGLYSSGDRAMILSKRSDKHFVESIKKHHPKIKCDKHKTYGYYRGNDPFTHGAFATYPAGSLVPWTKALAASVGNLHFCGEHTSLYHQWFMNWAVESGIIAGTKVVRLIKQTKKRTIKKKA